MENLKLEYLGSDSSMADNDNLLILDEWAFQQVQIPLWPIMTCPPCLLAKAGMLCSDSSMADNDADNVITVSIG